MTLVERDPDELRALITEAREAGDLPRLQQLVEGLEASLRWAPEEYQLPPEGDWWMWVARWGRGSGKTDTGSWYTDRHMSGPPCDTRVPGGHRGAIVGPTHGDVISACVNGPAGLRAHNGGVEYVNRKEGAFVTWPNGAECKLLGAHTESDADRLRAFGNVCFWWFDEAAMMRHLKVALDNVALGGRLGQHPHGIVTSTPKAYPQYVRMLGLPDVVQTTASTHQNPNLPASYRRVIQMFEGTRLGRQELHAELLSDFEGALWDRERIDADRVEGSGTKEEIIERLGLTRIFVGVDPSTWDPDLGDDPGTIGEGLETGIVVVGIDGRSPAHCYVLEDASVRGSGEAWAKRAARAYHEWHASSTVVEVNLGGLVLSTMRLIDSTVHLFRTGQRVGVRAAIGKRARAEPVATLAEQHRLHHVGQWPVLEDQLTGWDPRENWSPDRLDALVWAVVALEPWGTAPASVVTAANVDL